MPDWTHDEVLQQMDDVIDWIGYGRTLAHRKFEKHEEEMAYLLGIADAIRTVEQRKYTILGGKSQ
mgnify:FL=1|tara:strand:+ start:1496 stop:1690 length:195 start_codon:yes stop_codon:yes gene_type:complete